LGHRTDLDVCRLWAESEVHFDPPTRRLKDANECPSSTMSGLGLVAATERCGALTWVNRTGKRGRSGTVIVPESEIPAIYPQSPGGLPITAE
jgi:hypothetical protein